MYIVGFDAKSTMWKPIALRPEQTLIDARNTMLKYNISRIVLEKKGKPVGIITEKDISRFLYEEIPSRRMDEIRLDEVMSKHLVTVGPDADLRTCAKLMLSKKISSLLVVDSENSLKGIFTKTDLTTAYVEYFSLEHKVNEFMIKKVITVLPDEPVHSAIMLMSRNAISRVVVTKSGRPVGIVTGRDLLPLGTMFEGRQYRNTKKWQPFIPSGAKASMLISDIMTPEPITTTAGSDLADAAYIMLRNRISGLPVVDSKKSLIGIVTKTDVIRALASHA